VGLPEAMGNEGEALALDGVTGGEKASLRGLDAE
jgi:hypothetical protein